MVTFTDLFSYFGAEATGLQNNVGLVFLTGVAVSLLFLGYRHLKRAGKVF